MPAGRESPIVCRRFFWSGARRAQSLDRRWLAVAWAPWCEPARLDPGDHSPECMSFSGEMRSRITVENLLPFERVLVAGAGGWLGRRLVDVLANGLADDERFRTR